MQERDYSGSGLMHDCFCCGCPRNPFGNHRIGGWDLDNIDITPKDNYIQCIKFKKTLPEQLKELSDKLDLLNKRLDINKDIGE